MEKKIPEKQKGVTRLAKALTHSINGFKACFRTEEAFRQEVALAALLLPAGLWLGENGLEKSLLAGSVFIVLIVEMLNTAVERAIDRISLDHHPLSGEAKDMGSSAVLLSLILMGAVWTLVLFF
ncbi:MAG: diacylglycerol kinase [Rhodospirillales bacterium]|nr:diacylglycerol kinase [Alphaproteobacteria bacterium]USO04178.1 MAG: diacylglycerol kinase [Rhodospirillales bacterium]